MPVLETAYPSVSGIILKSLENDTNFKSVSSSESKKIEQVVVRPNTECTFEAKVKKGNVALTSWVIYDGHTGDKDKKLLTSEQIGISFKNSFPALGKYRIEGYGKPKNTDFEKGIYDKNYTDCSIDIEVVENKLVGKELIPIDGENFAKIAGGKMRLRQNFPASFKANFLMLPTDKELERLRLYVTDASGNVIKSVKVDYTVSFTPINTKALYKVIAEYKLASGELLTQSFIAETMTNSVSSIITHDAEVIRPGTPMSFSVKEGDFSFYVPNDEAADASINKEFEQVKWNLDGRLLGTGKSITVPGHEFVRKDKYVVEAYVVKANAYGKDAKNEADDWRFEVKNNDVMSFSYNGVPKVGKTTQLIADSFVISNLLDTELITWKTTIPHKKIDKKTISITPVIVGRQNVKCAINSEPGIELSIDVKQGKVLGMFFTDSNGIEIEKSSWLQTANIWVRQEHLIGEDLTIEIWDNDAFKNDYCKVINVPKYDGNLIPFTLDSYVRGKAGDWGMLYVKIGAPNLKLANTNNVFESKNHLDVEDKREIYAAHIGAQDGVKRHTHVDYNQISYFYAKSRGIKKEEQLSLAIYDKDKIILEAKNVHADESGMIKIKLEWNKVSLKLPMRIVYAIVKDKDENVLYNGARATTGPLVITKKSALLSLAEYKSAVLVGKGDIGTGSKKENKNVACECEARVRAFMRMLRVGEGTGELIKSYDKKQKKIIYIPHDFEKGYSTAYNNHKITDLSTHPQIIYDGDSSASGAYQVMQYVWWEISGFEVIDKKKTGKYDVNNDILKKRNITDFKAKSQDKISLVIMKRQRPKLIGKIIKNDIESAIRQEACFIWASLPENNDFSHYKLHGKLQPATAFKDCLEHYNTFLKEELAEKSPLHLEKDFLKEFVDNCCGEKSEKTNCNCAKKHIDLRNKIVWHSQYDAQWGNKKSQDEACWKSSQQILTNSGLGNLSGYSSDAIQLAKEINNHTKMNYLSEGLKNGIKYIDEQLQKNNPVLVGVNHDLNYRHEKNNDHTTDHFVVIVGRDCDNKGAFYLFYEVGTAHKEMGESDDNKLYILKDRIEGKTAYNSSKLYQVAQVRKNK
jgi:muramidase (phage lysozyme)